MFLPLSPQNLGVFSRLNKSKHKNQLTFSQCLHLIVKMSSVEFTLELILAPFLILLILCLYPTKLRYPELLG